jgi:hypothetical protein
MTTTVLLECSVHLEYTREYGPDLLMVFIYIHNQKLGRMALQSDEGKDGRSRRSGGEMHGRKLTKDAIDVFSQAANSCRTKSWLDSTGVASYNKKQQTPIIRHTRYIPKSGRQQKGYLILGLRAITGRSQKDGALADWALGIWERVRTFDLLPATTACMTMAAAGESLSYSYVLSLLLSVGLGIACFAGGEVAAV